MDEEKENKSRVEWSPQGDVGVGGQSNASPPEVVRTTLLPRGELARDNADVDTGCVLPNGKAGSLGAKHVLPDLNQINSRPSMFNVSAKINGHPANGLIDTGSG